MEFRTLSFRVAFVLSLAAGLCVPSAQTIVNDGDDLQALTAAAADGTVFEIHSNQTFLGSLSWSGKTLTIQAGPGYAPTIKGDPGTTTLTIGTSSSPGGIHLVDLTAEEALPYIDPFSGATQQRPVASFSGTGSSPGLISATFLRCTVLGDIAGGGTGNYKFATTITESTVRGFLSFNGTGSLQQTVTIAGSTIEETISLGGTGTLVQTILVTDSALIGQVSISSTGSANTDLDIHRTRFDDRLSSSAISTSVADVLIESCLFVDQAGIPTAGIGLSGNSVGRIVNTTVTGYPSAISGNATTTWENMLLFGNGADVAASVSSGQIANSLIEDGTYAGTNGNFQATPLVDSAYALLFCSPGADAGNDLAVGLGPTDLGGAARIQDTDGDGTAHVNVGALESPGGSPAATIVVNGSGVNPVDYAALTNPVIGTNFDAQIAVNGSTVGTFVALSMVAPAPYTVSGLLGEVLIGPSPGPFLDAAAGAGLHSIAIPKDVGLIGVLVGTQGARLELVGATFTAVALNGIILSIGV